ncbi:MULTISPECIES: PP2C family protein-serine/threonine phosphatase [Streptomyces]|uniref:Protein phosphatase n=3 Tax=Streptomyces TaxID=1883 RepID=A0A5P2BCW0_STRVZ|nr:MULTISPECIES: PP2C family protein-serine/threonine phosphatase [Streptomyces]MYY81182.1 SpoIIE family protein phosphatase [Streptomyces sp. SID335]MYZ17112.1 SpoIIE family protein phosphatase [Streptomyces sp. SID337]NEB43301.1 serine/threonine-protein phosphatase [Streptomyces sp. SID339]QES26159.1 protein phosphatase [Streptomyces venezuelae]
MIRLGKSLGLPAVWGAFAITYKLACPLAQAESLEARIFSSAVFFVVGTGLIFHARRALLRELRQMREVAGAAQNVLLRPLPPRIGGLAVAAGRLSASRGATVGGDLYEVAATEHGVRVVMGDVRGHGLAALATVAAVLGSFREAAHDEPELPLVLRRLERALDRHLRERARAEHPACGGAPPKTPVAEEFVTVLLLEIDRDGGISALNCGHPWPHLLSGTAQPLTDSDPLPPLGPFPLPADLAVLDCGRLLPGEALALHTDGMEDARDATGAFFPLRAALTDAVRVAPVSPQGVVHAVYDRLLRHTGHLPSDDAALLVLRNDRTRVPSQQREAARAARPAMELSGRRRDERRR